MIPPFSLEFLNSTILYALITLIIPIIIHMIHKRKYQTLPFAAMRFLMHSYRKKHRQLQIYQLLLLLLRCLLLSFIIFSLSRPVAQSSFFRKSANTLQNTIAIIIDNSVSTTYRKENKEVWELISGEAKKIISTMKREDKIIIYTTHLPANDSPLLLDKNTALKFIENIKTGYYPKNLSQLYSKAIQTLKTSNTPSLDLYFFSDFQATLFENFNIPKIPANIRFFPIKISADEFPKNVHVKTVYSSNDLLAPEMPVEYTAVIENHSDTRAVNLVATLYSEGVNIKQRVLSIPPKEERTALFTHTFSQPKNYPLYIEVNDIEGSRADDRYYFSAIVSKLIFVLIINSEQNDNSALFLSYALNPKQAPDPENGFIIVPVTVTPKQLATIKFSNYNTVIINGLSKFDAETENRLLDYVKKGGGVFLNCYDESDKPPYNSFYQTITGGKVSGSSGNLIDSALLFELSDLNYSHTILKIFKDEKTIESVMFNKIFNFEPDLIKYSPKIMAKFNSSVPALVENSIENGKTISLFSGINLKWTDFPSKESFVPFIHQIIHYLSRTGSNNYIPLKCGDTLNIKGDSSWINSSSFVLDPNKKQIQINKTVLNNQISSSYSDTYLPGHYEMIFSDQAKERSELYSINFSEKETDIKGFPDSKFKEITGFSPLTDISEGNNNFSDKQDLSFFFIIIALIFFFIESLFANIQIGEWD